MHRRASYSSHSPDCSNAFRTGDRCPNVFRRAIIYPRWPEGCVLVIRSSAIHEFKTRNKKRETYLNQDIWIRVPHDKVDAKFGNQKLQDRVAFATSRALSIRLLKVGTVLKQKKKMEDEYSCSHIFFDKKLVDTHKNASVFVPETRVVLGISKQVCLNPALKEPEERKCHLWTT